MSIKNYSAVIVAFSVLALAGCGSKTDANEENFGAAIAQYYDKKGDLCIQTGQWPIELSEDALQGKDRFSEEKVVSMKALEAAGLARSEAAERDVKDRWGGKAGEKESIRRYILTDVAKPFVRETDVQFFFGKDGEERPKNVSLCWGKQALDKVVKWEGPIKMGDYQEAGVTYRDKVINLAEWAQRDDIRAAFPEIKKILSDAGQKELRRGVFLTSEGWEARGLNR